MTRLDAKRYRAISEYAGVWRVATPFKKLPVDELAVSVPTGCAIYVVDDALGEVDYVGSVCRPADLQAVAKRLREHLRNPLKRQQWNQVTVVSLRPETPVDVVRKIESAIGTDLSPKRKQRLPRLLD